MVESVTWSSCAPTDVRSRWSPTALHGRVAVVAEAGRGLGRLLALDLARNGASVLVNHYGDERSDTPPGDISLASATAWEIHDAGGQAAHGAYDINSPHGTRALIQQALERWGRLDIVVTCAEPGTPPQPLTDEDWERRLRTGLAGTFLLLSNAWPVFLRQRYGRAVAVTPGPHTGHGAPQITSTAAAGALAGMVGALAAEGAPHNILVNCVTPPPEIAEARRQERGSDEAICTTVTHLASDRCQFNGAILGPDTGIVERAVMAQTPAH